MTEFTIVPSNAWKRIGCDMAHNAQDGLDAAHARRRKESCKFALDVASSDIVRRNANIDIGNRTKQNVANGGNNKMMQRSEIIILGEEGQCVCW